MRYEKPARLIELALRLGANSEGLTVEEISGDLGVGRRTVERMLVTLERLFPQLEARIVDARGTKRWRVPQAALNGRVSFTATELAALRTAAALARRDNLPDASAIAALELKVRALAKPTARAALETDLEALSQAEGIVVRPGPRSRVDPTVFAALRDSILALKRVRILHRPRHTQQAHWRTVSPYGFLYGSRHYLVAFNHYRGVQSVRTFALPNISAVKSLAQARHTPKGFDFNRWAANLFGVYDEKPCNIVWRFSPDAAADAREFEFHSSQKMSDLSDGGVEVKFFAGGLLEMAHHLLTWGNAVTVVRPARLRTLLAQLKCG